MSADDYRRRQPLPAEEMDLFYRALPLASHLGSLNEDDDHKDQGLELGLSLGGAAPRCKAWRRDDEDNDGSRGAAASKGWGDRCRILTAGDFPSPGHRPAANAQQPPASSPAASTSSVSSSSSSLAAAAGKPGSGTKRHAEAAAPGTRSNPPGQVVVGWPPIRAYRVNNLVNHPPKGNDSTKENPSARYSNTPTRGADGYLGCSGNSASAQENAAGTKEPEKRKTSVHLVKVNMDGMAIGRKVDLTAHASYNALALALEDMFQNSPTPYQTKKTSKLLDGSSEFVLTYEDKDGDWMLVGDVPWGMFLNSVRRLRIMRTCDANVLAPCIQPNTSGLRSIHP